MTRTTTKGTVMKITDGFMFLEHVDQHSGYGIGGDHLFQNCLNLVLAIQTGLLMRRASSSAQIEVTTTNTVSRGSCTSPKRCECL